MSDFKTNRLVKVVFDSAGTDSAGISNKTIAAHPSGVFIPDNAIILNAFYEVNTTFDPSVYGTDVEGYWTVAYYWNNGTEVGFFSKRIIVINTEVSTHAAFIEVILVETD